MVWPATTLIEATNGAKSPLRTTIWCRPSASVSSVSGGAAPDGGAVDLDLAPGADRDLDRSGGGDRRRQPRRRSRDARLASSRARRGFARLSAGAPARAAGRRRRASRGLGLAPSTVVAGAGSAAVGAPAASSAAAATVVASSSASCAAGLFAPVRAGARRPRRQRSSAQRRVGAAARWRRRHVATAGRRDVGDAAALGAAGARRGRPRRQRRRRSGWSVACGAPVRRGTLCRRPPRWPSATTASDGGGDPAARGGAAPAARRRRQLASPSATIGLSSSHWRSSRANERAERKRCSGSLAIARAAIAASAFGTAGSTLFASGGSCCSTASRDLVQRLAAERLRVGEQLVEDDAEREHVGAPVGRLLAHLLGRHVVGRAGAECRRIAAVAAGARCGRCRSRAPRGCVRPTMKMLAGLMSRWITPLRVREGERVGDAADDQRRLRRRRAPAFLAQLAQVAALEQLHRDVGAVVADAGVEDGDDVRVAEAAGGARFVEEQRVERLASLVVRSRRSAS